MSRRSTGTWGVPTREKIATLHLHGWTRQETRDMTTWWLDPSSPADGPRRYTTDAAFDILKKRLISAWTSV